MPRGSHGRKDKGQAGDADLDTVLYADLGGLRLDYVLPSARLRVAGAGVFWLPVSNSLSVDLTAASRHFPVWVDITLP